MSEFKDIDEISPFDREQYSSYFASNEKHSLGHWLSNLFIIPVYFLLAYSLVYESLSLLDDTLKQNNFHRLDFLKIEVQGLMVIGWVAIFTLMVPFLISYLASDRKWWRRGLHNRIVLVGVCLSILFYVQSYIFKCLTPSCFSTTPITSLAIDAAPIVAPTYSESGESHYQITALYPIDLKGSWARLYFDDFVEISVTIVSTQTLTQVRSLHPTLTYLELSESNIGELDINGGILITSSASASLDIPITSIVSQLGTVQSGPILSTSSLSPELEAHASLRSIQFIPRSSLVHLPREAYISAAFLIVFLMIRGGWLIYTIFIDQFAVPAQRWVRWVSFISILIGILAASKFAMPLKEVNWLGNLYRVGLGVTILFAIPFIFFQRSSLFTLAQQPLAKASHPKRDTTQHQAWIPTMLLTGSLFLFYILSNFVSIRLWTQHQLVIQAILLMGVLYVSANSRMLLSQQRAYLRHLTSNIRHTQLRKANSPTLNGSIRLGRIINRLLVEFFKTGSRAAITLTVLSILVWLYFNNIIKTQISLLFIPTFTSIFTLGFVIWFSMVQPRHIVSMFELSGDKNGSLRGLESQIRHELADQIKEIGTLLQLRQIENLHINPDAGFAKFATSSYATDFTEELRSLSIIGEHSGNDESKLYRIYLMVLSFWAIVRIRGRIQQRGDNSLQIWIEFNRRGKSYPVEMEIVPPNFSADLDESTIHQIARTLALKLILKVGHNYHLGSSWESFSLFIDGLKATVDGNWWTAIENYRTAIQIEEAKRGSFGLGHFYLGSVLVTAGEVEEGIIHLEQALDSDPLYPDTHYMVALTTVFKNWSDLDQQEVAFQRAKHQCFSALELRPHFAEVCHLLGAAYYQRGKLGERNLTRSYDVKGKERVLDYQQEYQFAEYYFRRAIRFYDRELNRLGAKAATLVNVESELSRLFRSRMTATHQLGDALRSQRLFAEADTYYDDFHKVFPHNLRTLIDISKAYCMAHQWQRADEFLSREVLAVPEATWDADTNLYMGWCLAGGIRDEYKSRIWTKLKGTQTAPSWFNRKEERERKQKKAIHLLAKAMSHLDFAIYLRPIYATRWEQTDWQTPFLEACELVKTQLPEGDPQRQTICNLERWLATRQMMSQYQVKDELVKRATDEGSGEFDPLILNSKCELPYNQLIDHYASCERLLVVLNKSNRLHGMTHAWNKLKLSAEALDNWKLSDRIIAEINGTYLIQNQGGNDQEVSDQIEGDQPEDKTPILFEDRWAYSVYFNISLFACRWLLESAAHETAWCVANESIQRILAWKEIHSQKAKLSKGTPPTPITPYVLRYTLSTLYAYKAYAAIKFEAHSETNERLTAIEQISKSTENPKRWPEYDELRKRASQEISEDIKQSLRILPRNSLAMFVKANYYASLGLYESSALEFERLAHTITPFDPINYIANWEISIKSTQPDFTLEENRFEWIAKLRIDTENKFGELTKQKEYSQWVEQNRNRNESLHPPLAIRPKMRIQEMISGQNQMANLVNKAQVHYSLAQVYENQHKLSLSVEHLLLATVWAKFRDLETGYLAIHAEQLERLERHQDAQAVSKLLQKRQIFLENQTFSNVKMKQPGLLESIMYTRREAYASSLQLAQNIYRRWAKHENYNPPPIIGANDTAKRSHATSYRGKLRNPDLIWFYAHLKEYVTWEIERSSDNTIDAPERGNGHQGKSPDTLFGLIDDQTLITCLAKKYLSLKDMTKTAIEIEKGSWIKGHPSEGTAENSSQTPPNRIRDEEIRKLHYRVTPRINIAFNISLLMLHFLCRESLMTLEQACQLVNNIVYNRVELGLDGDDHSPFPHTNREAIEAVIVSMEGLYRDAFATSHKNVYRYKIFLRNYYDTYGWLIFHEALRQDSSEKVLQKLKSAIEKLHTSLHYDQFNSISYFHLASVHTTIFEKLLYTKKIMQEEEATDLTSSLQYHLQMALKTWRQAKDNDVNNRLTVPLNLLGQKLEQHNQSWRDQLRSLISP